MCVPSNECVLASGSEAHAVDMIDSCQSVRICLEAGFQPGPVQVLAPRKWAFESDCVRLLWERGPPVKTCLDRVIGSVLVIVWLWLIGQ